MDVLDSQRQVSGVCFDLLLQELVPLSLRVSHFDDKKGQLQESDKDYQTRIDTKLLQLDGDYPGTVAIYDSKTLNEDEETLKVEAYGYSTGLRLTEVLMYKAGNLLNKIVDILDIMKFVCRDVWKCLFNKQMDNLRTNHRSTFVLIDNEHRLISRLNSSKGNPDSISKARSYLWFSCGLIRGVLMSFGVEAHVSAEISQFPSVIFNIQTTINN